MQLNAILLVKPCLFSRFEHVSIWDLHSFLRKDEKNLRKTLIFIIFYIHLVLMGFRILELQNRVTESTCAK